jgi:hypothetical protein
MTSGKPEGMREIRVDALEGSELTRRDEAMVIALNVDACVQRFACGGELFRD